jgi:hypothetical protein
MASYRKISSILTLLAVLMAAATSAAAASPLLSGYGGPGEGNQAILGSALVGGAGGGGRGPSSSGSSGSNGSPGSSGSSSGRSGRGASSGEGGGRAVGRGTASRAGRGNEKNTSGGAPITYPSLPRDDASQTTSGGSQALGLSVADLGYALLVLGVLVATGLVTRRLAQASTAPRGL